MLKIKILKFTITFKIKVDIKKLMRHQQYCWIFLLYKEEKGPYNDNTKCKEKKHKKYLKKLQTLQHNEVNL